MTATRPIALLMELIASEPHEWFLLRDGGHLLLDVNCSHSAFGFDMVVQLTRAEAEAYGVEGRPFVSRLAEAVREHALTGFKCRNVSDEVGPRVLEAIGAARARPAA